MDRYVLVQNVGTLLDSITARQHHMEVLALTEEVPASLFPLLPGPLPSPPPLKDLSLYVKGCSFKSATTLFHNRSEKFCSQRTHARTHWLSLWITGHPYPAQSTTILMLKKPQTFP